MAMIVLFLILGFSASFAQSVEAFKVSELTFNQKLKTVTTLKEFAKAFEKSHPVVDDQRTTWLIDLIDSAYANVGEPCMVAGWMSTRGADKLCTVPENAQDGTCGPSQALCNPFIFGDRVCIPFGTQNQKNNAFVNCDKEFDKQGRSLDQIVRDVSEEDFKKYVQDVKGICLNRSTIQSRTSMCKEVMAKFNEYIPGDHSGDMARFEKAMRNEDLPALEKLGPKIEREYRQAVENFNKNGCATLNKKDPANYEKAKECQAISSKMKKCENLLQRAIGVAQSVSNTPSCAPGPSQAAGNLASDTLSVAAKTSCSEDEKRQHQANCTKDLGCALVSNLAGPLLMITDYTGASNNGCINSSNTCLANVMSSAVRSFYGTITGVWDLLKAGWGAVKEKASRMWTQMWSAEDKTSDAQNAIKNLSNEDKEQISKSPMDWMKNMMGNIWQATQDYLKNDVYCEKWSGAIPGQGDCTQPFRGFECMSCARALTSNCAALGVVVGELLPAFITGGAVGLASAGAKGVRAASGFLKSSRAGRSIADKLKALPGPVMETATSAAQAVRASASAVAAVGKATADKLGKIVDSLKNSEVLKTASREAQKFLDTPLVKPVGEAVSGAGRAVRDVYRGVEKVEAQAFIAGQRTVEGTLGTTADVVRSATNLGRGERAAEAVTENASTAVTATRVPDAPSPSVSAARTVDATPSPSVTSVGPEPIRFVHADGKTPVSIYDKMELPPPVVRTPDAPSPSVSAARTVDATPPPSMTSVGPGPIRIDPPAAPTPARSSTNVSPSTQSQTAERALPATEVTRERTGLVVESSPSRAPAQSERLGSPVTQNRGSSTSPTAYSSSPTQSISAPSSSPRSSSSTNVTQEGLRSQASSRIEALNDNSNNVTFRAREQQQMNQAFTYKINGEASHHQSFIIQGSPTEYNRLMDKLGIPRHGPQGVNIDETIKMLAFRPGEKWIVEDLKSAENLLNQFRTMDPSALAKLSNSERELFNYLSERLPNYLQSARGERVEGVTKLAKKVEPIDPASPGSSLEVQSSSSRNTYQTKPTAAQEALEEAKVNVQSAASSRIEAMNSDSNTIRFRASDRQKMDQAGRFKIMGEAEHHQSYIIKGFPGEYDKLMSKLNIPGHGADRVDIQSTLKMLAFRPGDKWVVEDIASAQNLMNHFKKMDAKALASLTNHERELINYLNERLPNYIQHSQGKISTGIDRIPAKVDVPEGSVAPPRAEATVSPAPSAEVTPGRAPSSPTPRAAEEAMEEAQAKLRSSASSRIEAINSDANTRTFRASEKQQLNQADRFKIRGEAQHQQSFIIKGFPGEYNKLMEKLKIPSHGADRVDINEAVKMLAFRPGDKWVVEDIRSAENFVNRVRNLDPKIIQNLSNSERELVNYLNERFPAYIQNQRGVQVTPPPKIPLKLD